MTFCSVNHLNMWFFVQWFLKFKERDCGDINGAVCLIYKVQTSDPAWTSVVENHVSDLTLLPYLINLKM